MDLKTMQTNLCSLFKGSSTVMDPVLGKQKVPASRSSSRFLGRRRRMGRQEPDETFERHCQAGPGCPRGPIQYTAPSPNNNPFRLMEGSKQAFFPSYALAFDRLETKKMAEISYGGGESGMLHVFSYCLKKMMGSIEESLSSFSFCTRRLFQGRTARFRI